MKVGSYVLTLPRRVSNRNHFTASSKLICNILLLLFGTESYSGLHFSQTLSKLPAIYCLCSASVLRLRCLFPSYLLVWAPCKSCKSVDKM